MIPRIVAHRGFCKAHPENSLSAFRSAERIGCEWVECDVHSSADGVPVVIHDDTLDRTTSGSGPVAAKAFSDLSDLRLKFGDRGLTAAFSAKREVLRGEEFLEVRDGVLQIRISCRLALCNRVVESLRDGASR